MSTVTRILSVAFGGLLLLLALVAPASAAGAVLAVLALKPWRADFRSRKASAVLAWAFLGAAAGAVWGSTVLGPHGPFRYDDTLDGLLAVLGTAAFVGCVLVGGAALQLRAAAWPREVSKRRIPWGAAHFLAALMGAGAMSSGQASDAVFVPHARLVEPGLYSRPEPSDTSWNLDGRTQFRFRGHRLARGSGTVLVYRWYSPGSWSVIDDEDFEKLTIWIARDTIERGSRGTLSLADSSAVYVAYTSGGAAWPEIACAAQVVDGTLRYRRLPFRYIWWKVDGTAATATRKNYCAGPLHREGLSVQRSADELSPWLGGCAAEHVYRESYRRAGRCRAG